MPEENTANIERLCKDLAGLDALRWEWDSRFGAALAVIAAGDFETMTATLTDKLGKRWTVDDDIPQAIAKISGGMGGLRGGQSFFATSEDGDPILYCAWWPWGGNKQASIRVGCWSSNSDLSASLKQWFGL